MDALALLCNLHGDGPQTLERLHRAGCHTLASLASVPPADLARRLGRGVEAARRFQREARVLAERVGGDPHGGDAAAAPALERAVTLTPAQHVAPPARDVPSAPVLPSVLASRSNGISPSVSRREQFETRPAIDAVLEAWRARDAADPPPALRPGRSPAPRPEEAAAAPLAAGRIEGLNAERADALARAGVRDLASLGRADPLELARASGLTYTQITRFSYLARRAAQAGAPAVDSRIPGADGTAAAAGGTAAAAPASAPGSAGATASAGPGGDSDASAGPPTAGPVGGPFA